MMQPTNGNAVEDAILDLETLFDLEDGALLDAIEKRKAVLLPFL